MRKFIATSIAGLVLGGGVGLILWSDPNEPARRGAARFDVRQMKDALRWGVTEMPMAETEEMRQAIGKILNYDDGLYVRYTRGSTRIDVYLAYWGPGRMNYRDVASHTPDVCWPAAGWSRVAGNRIRPTLSDGTALPVAEHRTFLRETAPEYVLFWHLVGTEVHSYTSDGLPPWYATFTDAWKWGLRQRQDQHFVRVSSNRPLEELLKDPDFIEIAAALPLQRE